MKCWKGVKIACGKILIIDINNYSITCNINLYLGIEAQIPVEQDLMENGNIEFYAFRQSSDAFTVFGNRTPSYLLPHAVIINQINKTGRD